MADSRPIRHIRPHQPFLDWFRQLVERRETLWFFIWKDLKVQYQQPIFGLLWSVFQPLVYFGIILLVMHFSGRESNISNMPFALFLISGLAIWNFTSSSVLGSLNSIQSNAGIISKAYFPRFYLILSPVLKGSIDLLIMLMIVFGFALYFKAKITISAVLLVPFSIGICWFAALGWSAIAASLVVANRHVRHGIPVLLYAMIFALPVFYSMQSLENETVQTIYRLNPIAGSMDCFRAAFGGEVPASQTILFWALQSLGWLIIGILTFRKTEKTLADKV
jgi:lipopolysaccharide transport system permease protein